MDQMAYCRDGDGNSVHACQSYLNKAGMMMSTGVRHAWPFMFVLQASTTTRN